MDSRDEKMQNQPERSPIELQLANAESGIASAQFELGLVYESGIGVAVNVPESVRWFKAAATNWHPGALYHLGLIFQRDTSLQQGSSTSVEYFQSGAELGDIHCQCALADAFRNGRGISKDEAAAVHWYTKASKQGDAYAMYRLGKMYLYGSGVQRDIATAILFLNSAAQQGHQDAVVALEKAKRFAPSNSKVIPNAEATHSMSQLEIESRAKVAQISGLAQHLFKAEFSNSNNKNERLKSKSNDEIEHLTIVVSEKNKILKVFTRNYSQELQELHDQKDALLSQKKDIFISKNALEIEILDASNRKDLAYASLNHYKSCIDSWYAKSDSNWFGIFGNGGKKLPNHSFFGQSIGDLESYKYDRDCAYSDVQSCRNEIECLIAKKQQLAERVGELKNAVEEIFNKLNNVKSDRTHMYELKKEGHSKSQLQKEISDLEEFIRRIQPNKRETK